jgi:outer membrane protein assembly factor BamA
VFRRLFHAAVVLLLLPVASAQTIVTPPSGSSPRTAIRFVTFEKVQALSGEEQRKIVQQLDREDPDWVARQTPEALASFIEGKVLAVYQDRGYWRAKVSTKVTWVPGKGAQRQMDALITAIDEGEQYWLKQVRWTGVTALPEEELIRLFPLRPWELMSRAKVTEGLETIRKLYASRGYIAYGATPQTEFDDANHSVSLTIAVQEDRPFHFRNLSIAGLDKAASQDLQRNWLQMREQLYSPDNLRGFFEKFFPGMRSGLDALDYNTTNIDLDTHTVDILVSFLPTTQAQKAEQ